MPDWNWTLIDKVGMANRRYLREDDVCFYYMQRDSRGYNASPENDLISNFKKDPFEYRDRPDVLRYKNGAIQSCSSFVVSFFRDRPHIFRDKLIALVPMPTSNPRNSAKFDDRLDQVCWNVSSCFDNIFYAPVIDVKDSVTAAHRGGPRDPVLLQGSLVMTGGLSPDTDIVVLFDDVLTMGGHYSACKNLLQQNMWADPNILGLFLALHTWPILAADSPVSASW